MQLPLTLDEDTLRDEVRDLVGETVEEAINGILDAQADGLVNAERSERADERQAYRSGHYSRGLLTRAGKIGDDVPRLRGAIHHRGARALQEARELGRGGAHEDVPARRVDAEQRGRHRDPVG